MLKRYFIALTALFMTFQFFVSSAMAVELSPKLRTVTLDEKGTPVVLSLKQVQEGKRLFNSACAQCHAAGMTKTDPNLNLSPETLALANPPRNNIKSLVDYMKNPTTYDGFEEISELHPSMKSADIFAEMRNLSDDDLYAIGGHILLQPKIVGTQWAGGKGAR
ncbi:MAG: cytochrome c-550 [Oscillatoriales cyanobacterium]|uniref:Photosystem II extrinsic protein V n=1 Tax=Microcoleus anatoxicus PTRS2 TaxID=2705321 RepID=A0ABU8YJ73_9CYAN|nr:MAG: cytochrome c-550 [Oscillatoriales cyanobacterium]TAD94633.1 MAG: cytochrome c-550 [Oscillatoriales cyanobacterium]TAE02324.1 MAG: cytochrome c-550 [Oscillatoriales cyanobacterium]TAE99917.1 MAG: cytochrome c-550 [Oscillatoriales cyanobacterium]TAF65063.1 MAG: cytochrome c-550 [Oscillatoriales cyanobacterium]